jgi:hypothetical protein
MSIIYPWTGPYIVRRVRDAVIAAYRNAFSYDSTFTYVADTTGVVNYALTKISIADNNPVLYYFLPEINVITISGEEHRFIEQDLFEEFTDSDGSKGVLRGAPISMAVTINATTLDGVTRDEVVDRLYEYLKQVTTALSTQGIAIWKTSINPDTRVFTNDRWYYTSGVTLHLYVEWLDENLTAPVSNVDGFDSTITTDGGIKQEFKTKI